MKFFRYLILRIVLPVMILTGGIIGFQVLSARPEMVIEEEQAQVDPLVEWVPVAAHESGLDIETDGVVVPHREIYLSAEVAGRITFKSDECNSGNYVEAGALLLEIDPRDYELEVRRLSKEIAQAEADLQENNVEIQSAEVMVALSQEDLVLQGQEMKRVLDLSKRRVITESDIDVAKRDELAARNKVQVQKNLLTLQRSRRQRLQSALELKGTQLEKAELDLSRTKITAPLSGVIVEDLVETDTHVTNGTQLVRINDSSTAEVKCGLKMDELFWIWNQTGERYVSDQAMSAAATFEIPETPVTITYRLMDRNFHWQGVLSRYEGTGLDIATRTIPCRVVVKNPREVRVTDDQGRPMDFNGPRAMVTGMYTTVRVHSQPTARLLSVPESAVRPGNRIWVVRGGVLSIETIQPAETLDGAVILPAASAKIEAGDHVVTSPLAEVRNGMKVRESPQPVAANIPDKS